MYVCTYKWREMRPRDLGLISPPTFVGFSGARAAQGSPGQPRAAQGRQPRRGARVCMFMCMCMGSCPTN